MEYTTKDIEKIAYKKLWHKGWYGCFEVAIPRAMQNKKRRERVDLMSYETGGIFRCYEIKRTKSDFYSKCAWSFIGNYNYFIMPKELYEKVKSDIPSGVGVYIVTGIRMEIVVRPKYMELQCDKMDMMVALLQGLSREYKKNKWKNIRL